MRHYHYPGRELILGRGMASEFRIIRFRLDEVSIAIRSFAPRIKMKVPQSCILEMHPAPDGTPNALLRYAETDTGIAISNNRLAASLIAYCQKTQIPLPRSGKKSIQVMKDHVDLRISVPDTSGKPSVAIMFEGAAV
ncbi:MAG: hypothetical protein Kow0032_11110 [Methyloligellaceae bacterium]